MKNARKTKRQLTGRKVTALKSLARKIDRQEAIAIRAMGRAVLDRHARLREIVATLRVSRLGQGISLTDASRKSGIAKSNLSRLENSVEITPTLDTLERYANAIGMTIRVEVATSKAA